MAIATHEPSDGHVLVFGDLEDHPNAVIFRDRSNTSVVINAPSGDTIRFGIGDTDEMQLAAAGLTIVSGLTIDAGGATITAGVLSVDDTTDSSSAVTGSIHTDGGLGVAKNLFLGLTLEAGADGVGSAGEQLQSGGAAAECVWAAAASLREFKELMGRLDPQEALAAILGAPVHRFKYRKETVDGQRAMGTGDYETEYAGIVADEAPWAMHHGGRIMNPINIAGYTIAAFQAMAERIQQLEARA